MNVKLVSSSLKFFVPSVLGLWVFLAWAMYMNWIEPVSGGMGKSWFLILLFTYIIIAGGVPAYWLFTRVLAKIEKSEEIGFWSVVFSGINTGFFSAPIFKLFAIGFHRLGIFLGLSFGPFLALLVGIIFYLLSIFTGVLFSALIIGLFAKMRGLAKTH